MALPTAINVVAESQKAGPVALEQQLVTQFNLLLAQVRALCVKLDAETLAASDYVATISDSATSAAPLNVVQ